MAVLKRSEKYLLWIETARKLGKVESSFLDKENRKGKGAIACTILDIETP